VADDGALSNKRKFATVQQPNVYPDGPVVDAEGCIWSGLFGGWGLVRFSPTGEVIDEIKLPCANVTKAAFGGDDLRTLYITTAWVGLSEAQRNAQPQAGGLFSVRVETPGLPQHAVHL
jgi:xylono-1,5-lactonase